MPEDAVRLLDDASDPLRCGGKAAALAAARAAGQPVLPGFVLPVAWSTPRPAGAAGRVPGAAAAWEQLSERGRLPLIVRSSGVCEDAATSSLAGRFTSVAGVRGWPAFVRAVDEVLASADGADGGMAVLVQPSVTARHGGVLFGADPVSGDARRLVCCVAAEGPAGVVSGDTVGTQYVLSRRGRVLDVREGAGGDRLSVDEARELARLARRVRRLFGRPQDIEWLRDERGALWLLQSRAVTSLPAGPQRRAPLLGPGPVAETFPAPLAPLEVDLWVEPLRRGLAEALVLSGAVTRRAVGASPVVLAVEGRVAVDLSLVDPEVGRQRRSVLARLDPRPPARRLRAAWRVGRLRAALPALGRGVIGDVDRLLGQTPALGRLSDRELVTLMRRSRDALVCVHGHEVLAATLLGATGGDADSGIAMALRLAAAGRAEGLDDEQLVERYPTVLALVPPAITATVQLPADLPAPPAPAPMEGPDGAVVREGLRLRARWLQEIGARAARELGVRLAARGVLRDWAEVRSASLDGLEAAVRTATPLPAAAEPGWTAGPLPPAFHLTAAGVVVPAQRDPRRRPRFARRAGPVGDGLPSGAGRGEGPAHHGPDAPAQGEVLVVATLSPALAPWLPRLAGLVCESGSPLAHLAILAREYGVPAVLGVPDALRRFPAGTHLRVDGDAGTVQVLDPAPASGPPAVSS